MVCMICNYLRYVLEMCYVFQEGHYSYLETASTHKTLAMQIATFYLHLQDGIQRSKPTYSVTYECI
jgi:hypothetical protein